MLETNRNRTLIPIAKYIKIRIVFPNVVRNNYDGNYQKTTPETVKYEVHAGSVPAPLNLQRYEKPRTSRWLRDNNPYNPTHRKTHNA